MPEPLATHADYAARGYANPYDTTAILDQRLAGASRFVRAPNRAPLIDDQILEGVIDPELVKDVICAMVARAAPNEMTGFTQFNEGAGPFQQGGTVANPSGDFYLTKQEKKSLGIGGGSAFMIDLLPEPERSRGPLPESVWPLL